ncbi:MAG TPA: hypothetical protein VJ783_11255 [Pirellulales bacterium]|nr:hypothetical protein [Pirellulales bacterium]
MTDAPDRLGPAALAAAREYFRQPEPRFWEWDDDAIVWCGQSTIVFREELRRIVERLAADGLPRFTGLLLLLAACRDGWSRNRLDQVLYREQTSHADSPHLSGFDDLIGGLDAIHRLPAELRTSVEAKSELIEIVFEGCRAVGPKDAYLVAAVLALPPTPEIFRSEIRRGNRPHVAAALVAMRAGLAHIDEARLRLRLRTGLDQLIEPAETAPPPPLGLREFILRLRDDAELGAVGRLACDLLAAVQLPRALGRPDELPVGGVSDLSNRGPLDRLLVSELAHDDLTLAVRVAVGEALYLRREAPPTPPARQRLILLDSGIRMWGVPRVFATAAALAFAATAEGGAATCFRAAGADIEPAELATREGLVEHLERLETAPHPAAALPSFIAASQIAGQHADLLLITHDDVWADAEFRAALVGQVFPPDAGGRASLYLATVNRDGQFRLLAVSPRGSKLLREARLDLKRLTAPTQRPAAPLIHHDAGSELPAILSVEPFPLLLSHDTGHGPCAFHPKHGAVTITHDGRLMHWQRPGWAARQVTDQVPLGRIRHLSLDENGVVRLVVGGPPEPLRLLVANLQSRHSDLTPIEFPTGDSLHVEVHRGILLLVRSNDRAAHQSPATHDKHPATRDCFPFLVRAVDDRGQTVGSAGTLANFVSGRFFVSKAAWHAASYDGQAVKLTAFAVHPSLRPARILTMFDRVGYDGPWAITATGQIVSTVDGRSVFQGLHELADVVGISPRGDRIALRRRSSLREQVVHFSGGRPFVTGTKSRFVGAGDRQLLTPEIDAFIHPQNVRHRFHTIGVDPEGCLTLVGRRGEVRLWRTDSTSFSSPVRVEWVGGLNQPLRYACWFHRLRGSPGERLKVRVAQWPDGSRAYLDARGLLHLKSGDRALPELSLVIGHPGRVSAWSSDPRLWGTEFHTGCEPDALSPPEELVQLIGEFIARLR